MTKLLKFTEWQDKMIASAVADEQVTCPNCDGEGEIEEECHECGHEYTKGCDVCGGDGVVVFGSVSKTEQRKCFPFYKYYQELIEDIANLAAWNEKNIFHTMHENGIGACQDLRTKTYFLTGVGAHRPVLVGKASTLGKIFERQACEAHAH